MEEWAKRLIVNTEATQRTLIWMHGLGEQVAPPSIMMRVELHRRGRVDLVAGARQRQGEQGARAVLVEAAHRG